MPRSLRFEYPGAFYHVLARGNRRDRIFHDDVDRRFFLRGLGEAAGRLGWSVHAYVLLDNHYHLVLETPEPNLVAGMQWLQNAYTRRFNTRHRTWDRLFGDRYKSVVVEEGRGEYYLALLDYVQLNPVRAGLVQPRRGESVLDYPWSSLSQAYAQPPRNRPPWAAAAAGLEALGCPDTTAGRRRLVERLDRRAREEEALACGVPPLLAEQDARQSHIRRGWYWGRQAFAEALLRTRGPATAPRNRTYRSSPPAHQHDALRARTLLQEGLQAARLQPAELPRLPGNDPRKVAIAQTIRRQTGVSLTWLAEQLAMRSPANVSQILRRAAAGREGAVKIC